MKYLQKDINYKEETVCKWGALVEKESEHRSNPEKEEGWLFRGHVKKGYRLQTCFERAIADIGSKKKNDVRDCEEELKELEILLGAGLRIGKGTEKRQSVFDIEKGLIRRFKRQYYHFDLSAPEKEDVIEWLAVMQHYGAPTRLLDWTYSFYIAAFFAIEQAEGVCALWALEANSLAEIAVKDEGDKSVLPPQERELLKSDHDVRNRETWQAVFQNGKLLAYPVNPLRLNERLVLQQGVFLCPGDISKPFETNLCAVLTENNGPDFKLVKYIIDFDEEERQEALLQLHRMNINRASLFPGLEGFAKSLKTLLVSPANLLHPGED